MMKFQRPLLWTLSTLAVLVWARPSAGAGNERPRFIPESLTEYSAGYQKQHHRALDPQHADAKKYHAYRVITSGASETVIARSVRVDAAGHLHIIGEPGTVVRGKVSPGPGETHILLPIDVTPPQ